MDKRTFMERRREQLAAERMEAVEADCQAAIDDMTPEEIRTTTSVIKHSIEFQRRANMLQALDPPKPRSDSTEDIK